MTDKVEELLLTLEVSLSVDPVTTPNIADWDLPGLFDQIPGITFCDATVRMYEIGRAHV